MSGGFPSRHGIKAYLSSRSELSALFVWPMLRQELGSLLDRGNVLHPTAMRGTD